MSVNCAGFAGRPRIDELFHPPFVQYQVGGLIGAPPTPRGPTPSRRSGRTIGQRRQDIARHGHPFRPDIGAGDSLAIGIQAGNIVRTVQRGGAGRRRRRTLQNRIGTSRLGAQAGNPGQKTHGNNRNVVLNPHVILFPIKGRKTGKYCVTPGRKPIITPTHKNKVRPYRAAKFGDCSSGIRAAQAAKRPETAPAFCFWALLLFGSPGSQSPGWGIPCSKNFSR